MNCEEKNLKNYVDKTSKKKKKLNHFFLSLTLANYKLPAAQSVPIHCKVLFLFFHESQQERVIVENCCKN